METTEGQQMDNDFDEQPEPDYEGERYAEFGMSWVNGGGRASDVSAAWHQHKAMADGSWFESNPYPTYGGEGWDERELIDWEMAQEEAW